MVQNVNQKRKFYFIAAHTGYAGEVKTEYFSSRTEEAMRKHADEMRDELALECAKEHFWYDADEDETEEEFFERFQEDCGVIAEEITADEYRAQDYKVWSNE